MNLYVCVDKVKNEPVASFQSVNNVAAVRDNLGSLSHVIPLQDISIQWIGYFEIKEDGSIDLFKVPPKEIDLNSYKFPEFNKSEKFSAGNTPTENESVDNLAK